MLSSHGGEIFLHVLNSNRSTLEDPPSISEGCGGRVTDYRITVSSAHILCFIISKLAMVTGYFFSFSGLWWIHEGEPSDPSFRVFPWSLWEATSWEGQSSARTTHSILAHDNLPDNHLQHAGSEQHAQNHSSTLFTSDQDFYLTRNVFHHTHQNIQMVVAW